MFERENKIYKKRKVLQNEYQPEEFLGRKNEIQKYKSHLKPVINGWQPNNIFIYGKTGVGKTAVTRYMLKHLEKDAQKYDDLNLNTIFLNCEGLNSSYQVTGSLVNKYRKPENKINLKGYDSRKLYEMLFQEIEKTGGTQIIVLDEIDHIQKDDSIFYQLTRARENNEITESHIGIIGISNDFSFRDTLSPKVKSSLCEKELQFPAYDAYELKKILVQRSEKAFYNTEKTSENKINSEIISGAVLDLCAAYGAKDSGDARQALDLLMESADIAVDKKSDAVKEEHVEKGKIELKRGRIEEGIAGLTMHGHIVLYTLLTLERDNETPVRTRDIRPRYTAISKKVGEEPISPRRMRDRLGELAMVGVADVTEKNLGSRGGSFREYSLNMSDELVLEALKKTELSDFLKGRKEI